jgi:hypothetical protein
MSMNCSTTGWRFDESDDGFSSKVEADKVRELKSTMDLTAKKLSSIGPFGSSDRGLAMTRMSVNKNRKRSLTVCTIPLGVSHRDPRRGRVTTLT